MKIYKRITADEVTLYNQPSDNWKLLNYNMTKKTKDTIQSMFSTDKQKGV